MSTIRSTSTPPTGQAPQTGRPAQAGQSFQAAAGTSHVPRERVAQRAYEKWMKRGCVHGYDLQDWVEAERELAAEQTRMASSQGTLQGMRR